jgi:hypothetical protein
MATGTVQVPVLMSPEQKRRLARKAKDAKLTMGELLRQGTERFASNQDEELLHQVAKQVAKTTQRAIHSIGSART